MKKERIVHEAGNQEAWICICKNTPCNDGFYACDEKGNEVEPDEHWTTGLYVCFFCGRIIDPDTLEVVGRNAQLADKFEQWEKARVSKLNSTRVPTR